CEADLGPGFRGPKFQYLNLGMKHVARAGWLGPSKFVHSRTDDAVHRFQPALDTKSHRQRCCVPAARGKPFEEAVGCGCVVKVKWLRIEFAGEGLDGLRGYGDGPATKGLADLEVLEIEVGHGVSGCVSSALGRAVSFTRSSFCNQTRPRRTCPRRSAA